MNLIDKSISELQQSAPPDRSLDIIVRPLERRCWRNLVLRSTEERSVHALIIEDEPLIAASIEDILIGCGFTSFDLVSSTEDAVKAAVRRCPKLITADVELSVGTGIDAVNAICIGPPIAVIFITGSPNRVISDMPEHPLVLKPFTTQAVVTAVRSAMARHGIDQK